MGNLIRKILGLPYVVPLLVLSLVVSLGTALYAQHGAVNRFVDGLLADQKEDSKASAVIESAGARDTSKDAQDASAITNDVKDKVNAAVRKIYLSPGAGTALPDGDARALRASDQLLCSLQPPAVVCSQDGSPGPGRSPAEGVAGEHPAALPSTGSRADTILR